ncbi:MAG TPA: cell envelope integrity EipB family protein [Azospirillum sp.]|nr:cell envelope integrity EipB family protein [Azospirillum sp.]
MIVEAPLPNRRSAVRHVASVALGAFLLLTVGEAQALDAGVIADIQPHRAIYKMSLASVRSSSKVSDVRGRMMFEWADACDGWTTEQRFQLRFVYSEGDEMNMNTNYTTWEAKNGQRYRFNVRKLVNGETDEDIRGEAEIEKAGAAGSAHFNKPEAQDMELPAGSMFPTSHTLGILQHAKAGEKFFNAVVFDGADADGSTEVNTFIGQPAPSQAEAGDGMLKDKKGWPVRMAFFPLNSDSAQPEYEMSLKLLQNGVAESMQIDYGDFAIKAILESLQVLPKSGC